LCRLWLCAAATLDKWTPHLCLAAVLSEFTWRLKYFCCIVLYCMTDNSKIGDRSFTRLDRSPIYVDWRRFRTSTKIGAFSMYGSRISITSFRRNVGIGSSDDDFDGDTVITRRTSSSVTGWKTSVIVAAETHVRWRDTISGSTDIINTAAFLLKYLAKPSAVRNVEHWPLDLSRPSRLDSVCHSLIDRP